MVSPTILINDWRIYRKFQQHAAIVNL